MAKKWYIGADNFTKRNLPSGYTQLKYIQSSGTQYIDTGVKATNYTETTVDVDVLSVSSNRWVFGSRNADLSSRYEIIYIPSVSAFRYYYKGTFSAFSLTGYSGRRRFIAVGNGSGDTGVGKMIVNGTTYTVSNMYGSSGEALSSENTVYLFACGGGTPSSEAATMRLYSCTIRENGTLIRDYVPCVRDSDGAVGLYDLCNNSFCANIGTGTFTAGDIYAQNVAREVKTAYVGVNGIARKVMSGYVGVNGVARAFKGGGSPLSDLDVGTTVYMDVNGVSTEWIVVNQGRPSSAYDNSCDGTWLLMKDLLASRVWDSTNNSYKDSDIHAYLNGTFLGMLDSDIQSAIKRVKIPYVNGAGGSGSVASGSSGLSTKVFLPSFYEVGFTTSDNSNYLTEGACLSYFRNSSRLAYYDGTASAWWLRSPHSSYTTRAGCVTHLGAISDYHISISPTCVRPAAVLPSTLTVDGSFNVKTT